MPAIVVNDAVAKTLSLLESDWTKSTIVLVTLCSL
jgi:hypothetical protein